MIDVTYGNLSQEQADRMLYASASGADYPAGATEPWIADLLCALLVATGRTTVLETGGFLGHTSERLADTIAMTGDGFLTVCEVDPVRANAIHDRLEQSGILPLNQWTVRQEDALTVIRSLPDGELGLAFVDDDHDKNHVIEEIEALIPKMTPNGIMCFHDVFGSCDLQEVVRSYGGLCLDFPRAGPAGGLGIIQCS